VKQSLLLLMRWMRVFRLFQYIQRNTIVIWMIHGVMDDEGKSSWKPLRPQLSRKKLDEYLRILSKRYNFISLAEAVEMLQGCKPMQPYSMVFTFDDGYRNNLTHALPILRRYNAPATFFVPTGFVETPKPFWWDRLDYALQQVPVDGLEVRVGSLAMRLDSSSREALCESYKRLRRAGKKLQMSDYDFLQDMESLADQLETESGRALTDIQGEDDWSAIMTWEQIKQNCNGDVTIGSHTVDHIRLDLVEEDIAQNQLIRSKRDIELHTGNPCLAICYPSGNYSDEITAFARNSGYTCAVTTNEGRNRLGDDVFKLRRINLPTCISGSELLARLCGLPRVLSKLKACVLKKPKTSE